MPRLRLIDDYSLLVPQLLRLRPLPFRVPLWQADAARPITSGEGNGFVGEEDTVRRVAALRQSALRSGAIQLAEDSGTTVPSESARRSALVFLPVGAE